MTGKGYLFIGMTLFAARPAPSEVIEIDSSGEVQRYDGPAVFTGDQIVPITWQHPVAPGTAEIDRVIAEASLVHGIDRGLLAAVAWQESRGRMGAVSAKGATGVMQLMPATAAELGVHRDNLAENIHGGALYLRKQMDRFGSVPLALAAYNAGPGAVARYSGIPPYRETRDYVARIMARWHPTHVGQALILVPRLSVKPNVIEVSN